jgi:hypothetical protein
MSAKKLTESALIEARLSKWEKRPSLVIERGPNGRLRTGQLRIHEHDLNRVISPDRQRQDITDLLFAIGREFNNKTGLQACACWLFDQATRETVLWIEGREIINPEVERLTRDSWKEAAIDI